MRKLLALALLASPAFATYTWCTPVTFAHTKVPSNLTLYPNMVCFNMTTANGCDSATHTNFLLPQMKTVGNGGAVTSSSGFDLVWFTDATCTTAMTTFQLVSGTYVASTGAAQFFVAFNRSSSVDDVRYLGIGNASVTTDQGSTTTWDSDFVGVWPLPNGTTLTASDLTANAYNGTLNATQIPTATGGQVDGGASLLSSPSTPGISFGSTISPNLEVNTHTLEFWVKIPVGLGICTSPGTGGEMRTMSKIKSGSHGFQYAFFNSTPVQTVCHPGFGAYGAAAGPTAFGWEATNSIVPLDDLWHYVVSTWATSAGPMKFYIDGALTDTLTGVTGTISYGSSDAIGGLGTNGLASGTIQYMDEVRLSKVVRPADWITATYNNTASPWTFYTVGAPVGSGAVRHRAISQ